MRIFLLLLSALAITGIGLPAMGCAAAQVQNEDAVSARIDAALAPRIATREANGAVIVFRDGEEVYRRYIGMADWENDVPIDGSTVFRVASISKAVTAAAVLRLAAEGRLDLDDRLAEHLPGFPHADRISIRNLLDHSSGLGGVPAPEDPGAVPDLDTVIATFANMPLAFEPGTDNRYSGAGYVLLARVVEIVSGRSFDGHLRTALFNQLGMTSTGNFSVRELVPNRARGYLPAAGPQGVANVVLDELAPYLGEGSLQTTPDDLIRWVEAVRTGRIVDLSAQPYPYGWGVRRRSGRRSLEQTGLHSGFAASAVIYPEEKLSIVCLFNVQTGFFNFCGTQIAAAIFGEEPEAVFPALVGEPAPLAQNEVRMREGVYRARSDLAMKVEWIFGGLHFRWVNETTWQYLVPMADGRFYAPSESAILRFEGDHGSGGIRWTSGFDELLFVREE